MLRQTKSRNPWKHACGCIGVVQSIFAKPTSNWANRLSDRWFPRFHIHCSCKLMHNLMTKPQNRPRNASRNSILSWLNVIIKCINKGLCQLFHRYLLRSTHFQNLEPILKSLSWHIRCITQGSLAALFSAFLSVLLEWRNATWRNAIFIGAIKFLVRRAFKRYMVCLYSLTPGSCP